MSSALLTSLRAQVLDESEPLAGLLRKCLVLGAETKSESLRQWARYELNGYDAEAELPKYRRMPLPPLSADTVSGYTLATNMVYNPLQLPSKAREHLGDELLLRQPLEELEKFAGQDTLLFSDARLAYVQALWNAELEDGFQQVVRLSFTLTGPIISGLLGQIRTQLVDVVADLTADTPLVQLPDKEQVDAAVGQHIGVQYNTTVHTRGGPMAIGNKAMATSEGINLKDALRLLDAVRTASEDVSDQQTKDRLRATIADLQNEVQAEEPDTGAVVKKVGRLKAVATGIGNATLSAAVSGVVESLIPLAMSGAFG